MCSSKADCEVNGAGILLEERNKTCCEAEEHLLCSILCHVCRRARSGDPSARSFCASSTPPVTQPRLSVSSSSYTAERRRRKISSSKQACGTSSIFRAFFPLSSSYRRASATIFSSDFFRKKGLFPVYNEKRPGKGQALRTQHLS